jgi:hypothetical protein
MGVAYNNKRLDIPYNMSQLLLLKTVVHRLSKNVEGI